MSIVYLIQIQNEELDMGNYVQRGTINYSSSVIASKTLYLSAGRQKTELYFGFKYRQADDNYGGFAFYFYNVTSALIGQANLAFVQGSVYLGVTQRQNNAVDYQVLPISSNSWYWVQVQVLHGVLNGNEANILSIKVNSVPNFSSNTPGFKYVFYNTAQWNPVFIVDHLTVTFRGLFVWPGPNTIAYTSMVDIDFTPMYIYANANVSNWSSEPPPILSANTSDYVISFDRAISSSGFITDKIGMTIESALQQDSLEIESSVTSSVASSYTNVSAPNTSPTKLSSYVSSGMAATGGKFLTSKTVPSGLTSKIGIPNVENITHAFNNTNFVVNELGKLITDSFQDKFSAMFKTGFTESADVFQSGIKGLIEGRHVDFSSWLSSNILGDLTNNPNLKLLLENWLTGSSGLSDLFGGVNLNVESVLDALNDPTFGLSGLLDSITSNDTGFPFLASLLSPGSNIVDKLVDLWNLFINLDVNLWNVLLSFIGTRIMSLVSERLLDKTWMSTFLIFIFSFFTRITKLEFY